MMIMQESSNKNEAAPKKNGDERNAVPREMRSNPTAGVKSTAFVTERL
jgi:hypothetical protein